MSLKQAIEKLTQQQDLTADECKSALDEMLQEDANALQSAAFLTLLRAKKETPEELFGFVLSLKEKMTALPIKMPALDIVGTGGDAANTINISTGSAIIAASCGVKVVKHGNRAVSSLAGSADVLEALGVKIDTTPENVKRCVEEVGIGFCFSPNYHPAMLKMRQLRKTLGVPTTFNILGPLLNPASPSHLVLGVMDEALLPLIAGVLQKSGVEKALVVHGCGLDEISCVGPAKVIEITAGQMLQRTINPVDYGFARCDLADLKGGHAEHNAAVLTEIFLGKASNAMTDTLILNAAIALWVCNLSSSIEEAVSLVKQNLNSGAPLALLNRWKECSHDQ
jgi:anthranilate phosphoribosyltransferase